MITFTDIAEGIFYTLDNGGELTEVLEGDNPILYIWTLAKIKVTSVDVSTDDD